ncbi:MAG: glycosyltransferase family 2 protein [Pseudooceanicola sp.]
MSESGNSRKRLTYPGGFDAVLAQMEGRRDPMTFADGEGFPPPHSDLSPMRTETIGDIPDALRSSQSTFAAKCRELHRQFRGEPALCYFHALLIANLRRRAQPPEVQPLYINLWAEHSDFLLDNLDARWLVSAITTFGDHGATPVQREVGGALSVLFNTMKLYETERLFSGSDPDAPFPKGQKSRQPLPLQMDAYAIVGGGLDVNMLGRLWIEAARDPVIAPLAHHLLDALNADASNVFRRLSLMRDAREKKREGAAAQDADPGLFTPHKRPDAHPAPVDPARVERDPSRLRWGIVSTIRAPLDDIARFAAWHLQLGAARLSLYLDDADAEKADWLSRHERIEVTLCDDAYWAGFKRRPETHQLRQAANATQCYAQSDLHWLGHIDVDEFLLPDRPLQDILCMAPEDAAVVLFPPVERLTPTDPAAPALFKTTARMGGQGKGVLPEIYPTYGEHLRGGYVSHLEGKCFARTGVPGARFGIHALMLDRAGVTNRVTVNGSYLGHAHVKSWEDFRQRLDFRLQKGSYRKKDARDFRLSDVLDFLMEDEGEAGLKHFFDEVCTASPRLVSALAERNMLVRAEMDLDAAVIAEFGALPPQEG